MRRGLPHLVRPNSNRAGTFGLPPLQSYTFSKRRLAKASDVCNRSSQRSLAPAMPAIGVHIHTNRTQIPNADEEIPFCPSSFYGPSFRMALERTVEFDDLPTLPDPHSSRFRDMFISKCKYCCRLCNFDNPMADIAAKAYKGKALQDIHEKMKMMDGVGLDDEQLQSVIQLVKVHIGRDFSLVYRGGMLTDWSNIPELAWQHLSIVYQILFVALRFAGESRYFGLNFIDVLLRAIRTPCEVEQRQVTTVLKIYINQLPKYNEPLMWRFKSLLDHHIESNELPFFIRPMLKIMALILQNAEKHLKIFEILFRNHLIRLLSDPYLAKFHEPLFDVYDYFVDYKRSNASKILDYLVKHWPVVQNEKQVVYIKLMNMLLPKATPKDLHRLICRAFALYAQALRSHSSTLADQAMQIWGSSRAEKLLSSYAKLIIPIVLPALFYASKTHWSPAIRQSAVECIDGIIKSERRFVETLKHEAHDGANHGSAINKSQWLTIAQAAADKDTAIDLQEYAEIITQTYTPSN